MHVNFDSEGGLCPSTNNSLVGSVMLPPQKRRTLDKVKAFLDLHRGELMGGDEEQGAMEEEGMLGEDETPISSVVKRDDDKTGSVTLNINHSSEGVSYSSNLKTDYNSSVCAMDKTNGCEASVQVVSKPTQSSSSSSDNLESATETDVDSGRNCVAESDVDSGRNCAAETDVDTGRNCAQKADVEAAGIKYAEETDVDSGATITRSRIDYGSDLENLEEDPSDIRTTVEKDVSTKKVKRSRIEYGSDLENLEEGPSDIRTSVEKDVSTKKVKELTEDKQEKLDGEEEDHVKRKDKNDRFITSKGKIMKDPRIREHPEISQNPDMFKYWAQRYRLFSKFDEGIKMDKGGFCHLLVCTFISQMSHTGYDQAK